MFDLYKILKDLWVNDRFKFHVAWLNAVAIFGCFATVYFFSAVLATSNVSTIALCCFFVLYNFYLLVKSSAGYLQRISHLEKRYDALSEKLAIALVKNS